MTPSAIRAASRATTKRASRYFSAAGQMIR
jgi:hypothetical protein